jgi:hypothetical protein
MMIKKNKGLEWMLSTSGLIFIKRLRSSELYVLKDNLMLIWVVMGKESSLKKLKNETGFDDKKLLGLLSHLQKHKLIVAK